MRFPRSVLFISLFVIGSGSLLGCGESSTQDGAQQAAPAAPNVGVITVKREPTVLVSELPGRINAFQTAEIRPQVSGIILKREFTEGSQVKQGQPLYTIDPAPYEATLASAKAALARAEANLEVTKNRANRYAELVKDNLVSKQERDDTQAAFRQAQAEVLAAKAQVKAAQINVDYTKVRAPISGQISKSEVTAGALVTANQAQPLAVISQLDPIYVDITQSSVDLLRLKQAMANGKVSQNDDSAKVNLVLENGETYGHEGKLQFSEVTVDPTTGSVTLRAIFPNPDGVLLPGMYARAEIREGVRQDAMLVSQRGVTRNARGEATALVVNSDNVVEVRVLKTNRTQGDQWLIEEGLNDGDRVIVEGVQFARPGAPVNARPFQANAQQPNSQQ
ncbi:MAG: efflux RND transporter periplasmic adaptor subunit [Cellvibrio sp.]